jgi:hypothetical protein
MAMRNTGRNLKSSLEMRLSDALAKVEMPEGRARLKAYLASQPFPHFEAHPGIKDALIRIEANGSRSAGRFIGRDFVPLD